MTPVSVARIVSGGQTGADRAGLDAAIEAGWEYAGWCPAGGWAEDFLEPPGLLVPYPGLREAPSADPAVRTRLNVRDSHATLVIRATQLVSPGTDLTVQVARRLDRPCLVTEGSADEVRRWLAGLGHELTLNVAGPRESEQPGVYSVVRALLADLGKT
ncbi:putative molybdenum carrier protein [Ornithinimicrobium sp. F0845]|uniref:putative molybdenum carrier protein n=1 Tax=Ornithinimicrobium sp. F0845 TaxID=2926412 RepID=UPI001FF579FB|nr:putative molybdenum carrier protein [Ornithinimicrobium sp. F0845]